jgi:dicarboxylate transporter 10
VGLGTEGFKASTYASYDVIKERLLLSGHFTDSVPLHLITATLGGTIAVTACAPIDVIKSRVQSSTAQGVVSRVKALLGKR